VRIFTPHRSALHSERVYAIPASSFGCSLGRPCVSCTGPRGFFLPSHCHITRFTAYALRNPYSRLFGRCHHERRSARDLLLVLRVPHPLALLALRESKGAGEGSFLRLGSCAFLPRIVPALFCRSERVYATSAQSAQLTDVVFQVVAWGPGAFSCHRAFILREPKDLSYAEEISIASFDDHSFHKSGEGA
jgi:hypothetical protein